MEYGVWSTAPSPNSTRVAGRDAEGRKIFVIDGPFGQPPHTRRTGSTAPFWGEASLLTAARG